MKIRKAVAEDLHQMSVLLQHLNPADPILPADNLHIAWSKILNSELIHCLVAESACQLAATCTLVIVPNLSRSARSFGLIENVVTHEQFRRQGIGTALMKSALELAWSQGCYKMTLTTGSQKEQTLRFYERLGFVQGTKIAFVARPSD